MMAAPHCDLPIVFDAVSLIAGEVTILDNLTLSFAPGAPTILIGPNGSGKTTLLRIAMGLIAPTRGRIAWGRQEVTRPARGAIMFQRPTMLRRSASGNIRYALMAAHVPRLEHEARIVSLLELVGLHGLGDRAARRMSGGEQHRLALARALACDPDVLFLDEPTASLDPAATETFESLIRTIAARGIKVIMSTHDLGEARRVAGEVVLLNRGRVIEMGAASTFFTTPQTPEAKKFIAGELLL